MTILHIVGKPRSGKGVLMTFLGLAVAEENPVDANYHIEHPNCNCIDFYHMVSFLKQPRKNPPHLLMIDELPGWCDSYVSTSKSSRFATYFLNQSAKLGYDLIFTSQRTMRADINFRELSDVRLKAEKNEEKKEFIYRVLDSENTTEDIETGQAVRLPFELASTFWHLYDTYECVPPVGLDEMLVELQRFDYARMNETVNRQVRLLREAWEPRLAVTKDAVTDVLLENGESIAFAGVVASRFRRKRLEPAARIQGRTETLQQMEQPKKLNSLEGWKTLRNSAAAR